MMQQPAGWRSWAHQVAGTQSFAGALRYLNCCCQQLGKWILLSYQPPLFGATALLLGSSLECFMAHVHVCLQNAAHLREVVMFPITSDVMTLDIWCSDVCQPVCLSVCLPAGLYTAGMFLLYLLVRVSWSGFHRRSATGRPSNSFQLDLLVMKGLVCSWLGAHVVHCLGGAWLPWLLGWLVWCAMQLLMNVQLVNSTHSSVIVVLVALVVPLFMSWAPFRTGAIEWHRWAVRTFPFLNQSLSLGQLIPW
jgi:hypothetical protein